ncbi:MAG: hypothetical protein CMF46_03815 [Legionellales bacterium]|nr:hypothetical protein [Legionellales bacterium]
MLYALLLANNHIQWFLNTQDGSSAKSPESAREIFPPVRWNSVSNTLKNLALLYITYYFFYSAIYSQLFTLTQSATSYFLGPLLYDGLAHLNSLIILYQYSLINTQLFDCLSNHQHGNNRYHLYQLVTVSLSALITSCFPTRNITHLIGIYLFIETNLRHLSRHIGRLRISHLSNTAQFTLSFIAIFWLTPIYRSVHIIPLVRSIIGISNQNSLMNTYFPILSRQIFPSAVETIFRINTIADSAATASGCLKKIEKDINNNRKQSSVR